MNTMHDDSRTEGERAYDDYWAKQMADPEFRAVYEEEAAKKELWLQLVEARQAAGLTQADVAKRLNVSEARVAQIEERGYDDCTLALLRRYVRALGDDYSLEITVQRKKPVAAAPLAVDR